ncbi:hypothetical protein V6R21_19045 [Limibacter armeniacum]|uniref:DUF6848 family protein n=1 Tax=Limibacter armeniacum TaxID=466084 RepID=UPI002FE56DCD
MENTEKQLEEKVSLTSEQKEHCKLLSLKEKDYVKLLEEYGELFLLKITEEREDEVEADIHMLVKKPNRYHVNHYLVKAEQKPIEAVTVFLRSCMVAGDERICEDVEKLMAAFSPLQEMINGSDPILTKSPKPEPRVLKALDMDAEEFNSLKGKYAEKGINLHLVEVATNETFTEFISLLVKSPNKDIMNDFLKKSERVPVDAMRQLIARCVVHGDKRTVLEDLQLTIRVGRTINKIVTGYKGVLVSSIKKKA